VPGRPIDFELRVPFRRADAVAAGVSPSALRGKNFCQLFRGIYVHASVATHPLVRVVAALALHPADAFASHASAGRVYGVPLPKLPDEHISVFAAKDRRRRPGIRNHVVPAGTPVVELRGLRVSSAAQLFVELGELLGLVDLVVVGDTLVRQRRLTPAELVAFAADSSHPGAPAARRAASYVRDEVDSPMETRLRMLIVLAGLPEPKINHKILDRDGQVIYRFDLSYPDFKILVEYDGRQHREDLDQWDHDTDRRDWLDANGWWHVPVFSRGIYREPDKTLRRVVTVLRARGAPLPRRLSDDWRPHFPARG
jgi:very-short-patch-repair endonuclease